MKPNRRLLAVETLEDRLAPAVTASLSADGHTLKIVGTNAAEQVWITQDDANDQLTFAWAPRGSSLPIIPLPAQ